MNNTNEDAIYWILKEKEGFRLKEKEEFGNWLQNLENNQAYKKNKIFLSACADLPKEYKSNLDDELKKPKLFFNNFKIITSIAASVIIIFFMSYTYYDHTKVIYKNQFLTTTDINTSITLPDKSLIDLDVKSKINITYYKNERLVNLSKGKAFFSVAKDKKRPFIITSGNTRVEVLGTQFEVINLDNTNTINVIEGVVRVSHIFNDKIRHILVLKQGDSLSLNSKGKVIDYSKVILKRIASWKKNLLIFDKTTLKEALEIFNRYDSTKVAILDYETSQLKVSGEFLTKDFDKFLEALPFIYPIKISKKDKIIKIEKK